jgi:hypothetical protein
MDWKWVPGMELEEDEELEQNYGNRMPKTEATMFVCRECGGLNKHLRSCTQFDPHPKTPLDHMIERDQCEYCRAPGDLPHHPDCPNE